MLRKTIFVAGIALCSTLQAEPLKIEPKPVAIIHTPDSILKAPPGVDVRYAGDRPRYSTCSGVKWFQESNYLFAVSMHASSVQLYSFNPIKHKLKIHRNYTDSKQLGINRPENIDISPDGSLLAISTLRSSNVQIYSLDENNFMNPVPLHTIKAGFAHGARFSPDGKTLGHVELNPGSKFCFHKIERQKDGQLNVKKTQSIKNPFKGVAPKSLDFSKDGRFVVIGCCVQLKGKQGAEAGVIASFHFDQEKGCMDPKPISIVEGIPSVETLAFAPNSSSFVITDQVYDKVYGFHFNQETGEIGPKWLLLENPDAQLCIPHGIAFSDKFVAVTSCGDDKVTVYEYSMPEN